MDNLCCSVSFFALLESYGYQSIKIIATAAKLDITLRLKRLWPKDMKINTNDRYTWHFLI